MTAPRKRKMKERKCVVCGKVQLVESHNKATVCKKCSIDRQRNWSVKW